MLTDQPGHSLADTVTGESLSGLLVRQPGELGPDRLGTTDIVQRCRQHEFVAGSGGNGLPCALQRVPALVHRLPSVGKPGEPVNQLASSPLVSIMSSPVLQLRSANDRG